MLVHAAAHPRCRNAAALLPSRKLALMLRTETSVVDAALAVSAQICNAAGCAAAVCVLLLTLQLCVRLTGVIDAARMLR